MSDDEEEAIYCVCRSSDVSRFMIGCDHCEEWYHGDCINVTASTAKYIKKFYCKECRDKNSHLEIVYKSKYAEKLKKEHKKDKRPDKDRDKEKPRDKEKEKKHSKEKKSKKDKDHDRSRSKDKHKEKKHKRDKKEEERSERKEKIKQKPLISSDTEEEREKDRERERVKEERERERELMVEREKLRAKRRKEEEERKREAEAKKEPEVKKEPAVKKERGLSTDSINRNQDSTTDSPVVAKEKQRKILQVKNVANIEESSEDEWKPIQPPPQPKPAKRKVPKEKEVFNKKKRPWRPTYESSDDEELYDLTPRQCSGSECVNSCRVGSKYCSDQCGLSLAAERIYNTLPARLREWSMSGCKAEEKNRKELERIRKDIQEAKQRLHQADKEAEALEHTISRAKTLTIIENKSDDSSDDDEEMRASGAVNCISCGKDVPSRTAIRHMESCFNKFESQTSFGSMYKTKIEGYQMFCDFYNPQTETYCKRLRVICPEHTKEPKILDSEVCGFPHVKGIFTPTGEFCRHAKKECNEHYSWEKLRRAELDMDRVRAWLKLDELLEKERQEKEAMSRRAGFLNLLLHSTFDHTMSAWLMMQQQKQSAANRKQQQQQHAKSAQRL